MNALGRILAVLSILTLGASLCHAQTLWWSAAKDDEGTGTNDKKFFLSDVTIPLTTSDPLGGADVFTPIASGFETTEDDFRGGIVIDKTTGVCWYTDGIADVDDEYTIKRVKAGNHTCTPFPPLTSLTVEQGATAITGNPDIIGLAYERSGSTSTSDEVDRIWALMNDSALGEVVGLIDQPDRATFRPIDKIVILKEQDGTPIQEALADIAWDSVTAVDAPNGFLWGITCGGKLYRWVVDSTATSWDAEAEDSISGGTDPSWEGITLDTSRPMTLPLSPDAGAYSTTIASGTIIGLDTKGDSSNKAVARTLIGRYLTTQETYELGAEPARPGLALGISYSAEPVRTGSACSAGTCGFGGGTRSIDLQYNTLETQSNVCSSNPAQPLIDECPGTGQVDVEWCNPVTATNLTPYLLVSSSLNPTAIGSGGVCTADPDLTTATNITGPATPPLALNSPVTSLTADARTVRYIQWVFMCGGTSVAYDSGGSLQISDSFRIAWSNP